MLKSFRQKDRYGNEIAVEFAEVPPMATPQYDHPGDPKGTDTVPAWLTPGEFVINAEATRKYEPLLEEINNEGREMQQAQGGSVPTYASDGGLLSSIYDSLTMPSAPPGIVYKRLQDGSIGQFTERTGTGGGQKYLGRLSQPKKDKGNAFSRMIGVEYKDEGGITGFLNKYVLGPNAQIGGDEEQAYVTPDYLTGDAREALLDGLMQVESGGDVNATSEAGAIGPYQIMPATGAKPGMGVTPISEEDLRDPTKSRRFAGDYLEAIARENPDFTQEEVIAAYHSGAGNVRKAKEGTEALGPRGQSYAGKVLSAMNPVSTAQASTLVPPVNNAAPPKPTALGLTPGEYEQFEQQQIAQADNMVAGGDGDDLGTAGGVPEVKEDEPFSIFGFQPFVDNRPDSVKERNAAFNRKATRLNAEGVGESFKEMEIKRQANIEAGRDEFEGINQHTYAGLKDAVKYQQGQMIEETEDYAEAAGLSVPEMETMLQQERVRAADIGVPTPEEIEVAKTQAYQDHVSRSASAGKTPMSPNEFAEYNTPNEEGVSPSDRANPLSDKDKIAETEDEVITAVQKGANQDDTDDSGDAAGSTAQSVIDETEGEKSPESDNTPPGDVENAGKNVDPSMLDSVKGWFTEAFSDLFSGPELARMAIMYAGSRAMGYSHAGSLNFSMKSYMTRVDSQVKARQEFITDEDNLEAYTKESLEAYRKSGKVTDLVAKAAPDATIMSEEGFVYIRGVGEVPKVKLSDKREAVLINGKPVPLDNELIAGRVEPYSKEVHGNIAVAGRFGANVKDAVEVVNQGVDEENRVVLNESSIGSQAANIYHKVLKQNAVSIRKADETEMAMQRAITDFAQAQADFKSGKSKVEPRSLEQFFNKQILTPLVDIPQSALGDISPENLGKVTNIIKSGMDPKYQVKDGNEVPGYGEEYYNEWQGAWNAWTNLGAQGRADAARNTPKNKGWSDFTYWLATTKPEEIEKLLK